MGEGFSVTYIVISHSLLSHPGGTFLTYRMHWIQVAYIKNESLNSIKAGQAENVQKLDLIFTLWTTYACVIRW